MVGCTFLVLVLVLVGLPLSGSGFDDLAKLLGQARRLTRPADLAAKAAPQIEARTRDLIRGKSFPAREDGTPSTASTLADYVSVQATGTSFRLVIDHPAATFLQDGTSRMAARELLTEDEFRAIVEDAFAQAVAEVMGGK